MTDERKVHPAFPPAPSEGAEPVRRTRRPAREPEFRINREDLAFLRSIGIDPTRRR